MICSKTMYICIGWIFFFAYSYSSVYYCCSCCLLLLLLLLLLLPVLLVLKWSDNQMDKPVLFFFYFLLQFLVISTMFENKIFLIDNTSPKIYYTNFDILKIFWKLLSLSLPNVVIRSFLAAAYLSFIHLCIYTHMYNTCKLV